MDDQWAASALSRGARPLPVAPCAACGRERPSGYRDCPACHDLFEGYWRADWAALLEREEIGAGSDDERVVARVVIGEWDRHPFTALDIAMTLLACDGCGRELGASYTTCWPCKQAFGYALAAEGNGCTQLDHAWHIGRWVVRHPDQHSAAIVRGWTEALPRLVAGDLPSIGEAQRGARDLKRALRRM